MQEITTEELAHICAIYSEPKKLIIGKDVYIGSKVYNNSIEENPFAELKKDLKPMRPVLNGTNRSIKPEHVQEEDLKRLFEMLNL